MVQQAVVGWLRPAGPVFMRSVGSMQMFELAVATDESEEVRVEGMPPETYLERFAWDEAKYPPRRPLNETVTAITDIVQQLEDGLKVRSCPRLFRPQPHVTSMFARTG